MRVAALPLLAAQLTRDPGLISGLTAAVFAPWIVFGLLAGAWADRWDRRRLLWTANLARVVLYGGLFGAILTHRVDLVVLYVVAFAIGAAETVHDTAAHAVLPSLIAPRNLEGANSRLVSAEVAGQEFVGPPVGSFLFAAVPAAPFVASAMLVAASAANEFALRLPQRVSSALPPRSLRVEVGEGVRWLATDRLLRVLVGGATALTLLTVMWESYLVLYVLELLKSGQQAYGFVLAAGAVGGILGGLLVTRITVRLGQWQTLLGVFALCAAAQFLLGVFANLVLTGVLMALTSLAFAIFNVVAVSLRQRLTPDELLGRVSSVSRTVSLGFSPIGALLGGAVAHHYGLQTPFFLGAPILLLVGFVVAVAAARDPRLRDEPLNIPQALA